MDKPPRPSRSSPPPPHAPPTLGQAPEPRHLSLLGAEGTQRGPAWPQEASGSPSGKDCEFNAPWWDKSLHCSRDEGSPRGVPERDW